MNIPEAQTNLLSAIRPGMAKSGALLIFEGSLYVPGPGVFSFGIGSGLPLDPNPYYGALLFVLCGLYW